MTKVRLEHADVAQREFCLVGNMTCMNAPTIGISITDSSSKLPSKSKSTGFKFAAKVVFGCEVLFREADSKATKGLA